MLDCKCFSSNDRTSREKFQQDRQQEQQQKSGPKKSAPLTLKLLNLLGLRSYVFNKFIFRKLPPKYTFEDGGQDNTDQHGSKIFYIGENRQQPALEGYHIKAELLQENGLSVPVILMQLSSQDFNTKPYIIYSHGNSSDLSDAFLFFKKLVQLIRFNVVVYDYSGYGISKAETTQRSVCQDLQLVLRWLKVAKQQIILWGFSLGSFPTVTVASKCTFGGVILQSPIASGACFFDKELQNQKPEELIQDYTYDFDCLDNLSNVGKIQSQIILMHSSSDEIIPLIHVAKLYRIIKKNNKVGFSFLEVDRIKHNEMHYYLSSPNPNSLNKYFMQIMAQMEKNIQKIYLLSNKSSKTSQIRKNMRNKAMKQSDDNLIRMKTEQTEEGDWQIISNQDDSIQTQNDILEIGVKNHKNYFGLKNLLRSKGNVLISDKK